jgi:two-component system, OmpR family, sensor kinase
MKIKLRIVLFQCVFALAVIVLAAIALATISVTTKNIERVQLARLQLDAATQLAVHANRYSEQIAELLLLGAAERPDFEDARQQVTASFRTLSELTREEIALELEPGKPESVELGRLRSMRSLFRQIDLAVERVLLLSQEGRQQEAIAVFRSEIENRLDADFERLIAAALADERSEAALADEESANAARRLTLGTIAVLALVLGVTAASGVQFYRAIGPGLSALIEGTLAIGRGDLSHRVRYDQGNELGRLAGRFNDMAEELERQRRLLLESRAALQGEVAERTEELAKANRRLIELDQQRLRLLADVSHELRTPLTVLRGEAEVALRGMSKPEGVYREALELIVKLAADMARLVEDLLFLARSEADDLRFELASVRLVDVVREAIDDASLIARRKQIRLSFDALPPDLAVRADARRLKQVLLILLDNAIKYSPPRSVVDIGLVRTNGTAEVIVTNEGEALHPADLPQAFERFFRGENARAQAISGNGLGLPIARWIVEKHGGELILDSEPSHGTTVTMRLPAEAAS